ncbi:HAD family hydrolase [Streptomyces broussonetiae]|uniref:HAD family hydrolase n=1 Tax=Streptomyces broussonetiae TaxID=2686304 RepID=UPI001E4CD5A1|nr:HAD family hydrolase [Streptomyces broussonetiae]
MTSDATSDAASDANEIEKLRELITPARFVLWDFDGPICRLFAGRRAEQVAAGLVEWLERQGLHGLLTDTERETPDPQTVLRAVGRRHPDGDLVTALEERLTQEELRAARSALPTAYADPLIRTWTAVGARQAVITDASPRVVRSYLETRGLLGCFGSRLYGRTEDLHHPEPDPHRLSRALGAMGAEPSAALMIGGAARDITAARRAGVPFLGHARNEAGWRVLRAAGAGPVVCSLQPLLRALRAGPLR